MDSLTILPARKRVAVKHFPYRIIYRVLLPARAQELLWPLILCLHVATFAAVYRMAIVP